MLQRSRNPKTQHPKNLKPYLPNPNSENSTPVEVYVSEVLKNFAEQTPALIGGAV